MIESGGENIWFVRAPLSLGGVQVTTQMSIIKNGDDKILLISPVEISPALKEEILRLGQVCWIVAPNNFHHFYIQSALNAFPSAQLLCPQGLGKKRKDLPAHNIIDVSDQAVWGEDLIALQIYHSGLVDEHVFLHKPSKTLVLTDLFMLFNENSNFVTKVICVLVGVSTRQVKMSRMMKLLYRDKNLLRDSFQKILSWDFQRVHLAHSRNIEENARAQIQQAMSFLL